RATLDGHLLEQAVAAGCELLRPAKVTALDLQNGGEQTVAVQFEKETRTFRARWIVDASGRAAMIARKLGHYRPNTEHPINAVWARYGANVSPITRTVVELDASGPRTIFSGAA